MRRLDGAVGRKVSRLAPGVARILERAEALASGLLREAGATPGADPFVVAERLGYEVVAEPDLPPGQNGLIFRGDSRILYRPSGNRRADAFVIAHECLEHRFDRPYSEWLNERFCQRGAAALLMERNEFLRSVAQCKGDLFALAERWRHAEPEAIAWRMVDLLPEVEIGIWNDDGARYRLGLGNELGGDDLSRLESEAVSLARRVAGFAVLDARGVRVRAWCWASSSITLTTPKAE